MKMFERRHITQSYESVQRQDLEAQSTSQSVCNHMIWWRVGVDLPLMVIYLIIMSLFELGFIPTHKRGFFCNDPELSHKFTGDTVTAEVIMSTSLFIPFMFFLVTEYLYQESDFMGRSKLRRSLSSCIVLYRTFLFGYLLNLGIVSAMKGVTGNPRPSFFDVCQPDTAKTCNGSEYITTFECTSTEFNNWYHLDSYRSFPSGHTSLSVYCGFFLAWYLQRRAFSWQHRSVFLVPVLQLLCVCYAAVCSLTRMTDHRHHWWDVAVGTCIGLITVIYAVVLTKNFSYNRYTESGSLETKKPLASEERRRETIP